MADTLYCKFCGKQESDVETLVAGPDISICSECIGLLGEIVAKERPEWRKQQIAALTKLDDPGL
jgi:ATP-dependent protease Clp ATPase subunit